MRPEELTNPFVNFKLDDTVSLPAGDVPELHARVLEQCRSALAQARQAGESTSLLVIGEAGSGKSHMIAQFRKIISMDPRAVLAAIRLGGASSGCLWRHLRERLVSELLRKFTDASQGENGLLRLLRNRFPKWALGEGPSSAVLEFLFRRPNAAEKLRGNLDQFAENCATFDYRLRKVLPSIVKSELAQLSRDWLRGVQLTKEDLERLGLPPEFPSDLEQETIARSVVLSLLQLAGNTTTLFIFFDEVEAIQAGNHDAAVLRQFAMMATELLAETGARVIATSIRPVLHVALTKAIEVSNLQKMTQFVAQIPALTWEQTVRVERARLDAESTCRKARLKFSQDPDWPLGGQFLEKTFKENRLNLTPRHLIRACGVEFGRLQKGNSSPQPNDIEGSSQTAIAVVPVAPKAAEDELTRLWHRQRKKHLERPQSIQFDSVLALGLPWLAEISDLPLVQVQDRDQRLGDVNLVFQPHNGKKPIGVSFCNHEPKLLWRRLDRLIKQWKVAKNTILAGLVILRSETERTTNAADQRFELLVDGGARFVRLPPQQLAELTAFQVMLTATLEGEMTRTGKPLDAKEYDAWASANLSGAVKELLDQVFDIETLKGAVKAPRRAPKPAPTTSRTRIKP